jgi:hypothetical protein
MTKRTSVVLCLALTMAALAAMRAEGAHPPMASTPEELVAAYDSLTDTILASKQTERNLVFSILAMTYRHAEAAMGRATPLLHGGQDARAEIETLAALVSQIANEGDASVAGIRKRLVEGGHHHNAAGEQQGIYDEGFVIVTRAARKSLLDSAGRIGRLGRGAGADSLETEWKEVSRQYDALMKEARR